MEEKPMPEKKPTPSPKPRHARLDAADAGTAVPEPVAEPRCRVPRCAATPEWRGLCSAHRMTHRGLAASKEVRDV